MFRIPPGPLTADAAEMLTKAIQGLIGRRPTPQDYRGGLQTTNIVAPRIFPAKLTAVTSGLYSWREQTATGADYSGWEDLAGGESGTDTVNPAYEPNDVAIDVSDEPVVFLMREYYDATLDWVYVMVGGVGGGGGSSLITTDGVLTVNPTNELLISTGLVLSTPSSGVAELVSPRSAFVFGGNAFGPVLCNENTLNSIATVSSATTGNAVVTGSIHTWGTLFGPPKDIVLSLYTVVSGVPTTLLASASANDGNIPGFLNGVYASVTAILPVIPGTQINLYVTPISTNPPGSATYTATGSMNMIVVP